MKGSKSLAWLFLMFWGPTYGADIIIDPAICLSPSVTETSSGLTLTVETLCKGGVCINRASVPDEAIADKTTKASFDAFVLFRQQSEELLKCTSPQCLEIADVLTNATINGIR